MHQCSWARDVKYVTILLKWYVIYEITYNLVLKIKLYIIKNCIYEIKRIDYNDLLLNGVFYAF